MAVSHCHKVLLYFSSKFIVHFSENFILDFLSSNLLHSIPPPQIILSDDGLTSYFTEKDEKPWNSTHSSFPQQLYVLIWVCVQSLFLICSPSSPSLVSSQHLQTCAGGLHSKAWPYFLQDGTHSAPTSAPDLYRCCLLAHSLLIPLAISFWTSPLKRH